MATGSVLGVDRRVDPTPEQCAGRCGGIDQIACPIGQFGSAVETGHGVRPGGIRRGCRRQSERRLVDAVGELGVGREQFGNQRPPRHAVDHQVVDLQQQPSGVIAKADPRGRDHLSGNRVQGLPGLPRNRLDIPVGAAGHHGIGCRCTDVEPPGSLVGHQACAQHVVTSQQDPDRPAREVRIEVGRNTQQRGLVEAADPVGVAVDEFFEPAHDREGGHRSGGDVGDHRPCGTRRADRRREFGGGAVAHHVAGGDSETLCAQPGDELHSDDAVPAELEEVLVETDLFRGQADDVGDRAGHRELVSGLWGANGRVGHRVGQPPPIQFPVRQGGHPVKADDRRRNHVVGQHMSEIGTQCHRIGNTARIPTT